MKAKTIHCYYWCRRIFWSAEKAHYAHAMISPTTKSWVRVTIRFLVRGRVRIRIRIKVWVGVTFNNVSVYHNDVFLFYIQYNFDCRKKRHSSRISTSLLASPIWYSLGPRLRRRHWSGLWPMWRPIPTSRNVSKLSLMRLLAVIVCRASLIVAISILRRQPSWRFDRIPILYLVIKHYYRVYLQKFIVKNKLPITLLASNFVEKLNSPNTNSSTIILCLN